MDRLELRLARFGFEGSTYTLSFDPAHLPATFLEVRNIWRRYLDQRKWHYDKPFDYVYLIEGKHGDHRFHIHLVLRNSDFASTEVRHLWKYGGDVDDEPLLRGPYDSYRRTAKYFNKEATDGITISISARTWVASRSLKAKLPPPDIWRDHSGCIEIPDNVRVSARNNVENSFGSYYYGWYIEDKTALYI